MATTLYARNVAPTAAWTPTPLATFVSSIGDLSTSRGSGVTYCNLPTAAGKTAYPLYAISPPLAAAVTISGTATLNLRCFESNMSANVQARVECYKFSGADGTIGSNFLTGTPNFGTEMDTAERAENWTSTTTSTAFVKGDRIVVALGFAPSGTENAGYLAYIYYNGTTGGASGDTYVTFAETITFASTPAGTTYYPTDTASDVSTADDDRAMSTSRGAGATSVTAALISGANSAVQMQHA